jgi:hypothetical protein
MILFEGDVKSKVLRLFGEVESSELSFLGKQC